MIAGGASMLVLGMYAIRLQFCYFEFYTQQQARHPPTALLNTTSVPR